MIHELIGQLVAYLPALIAKFTKYASVAIAAFHLLEDGRDGLFELSVLIWSIQPCLVVEIRRAGKTSSLEEIVECVV